MAVTLVVIREEAYPYLSPMPFPEIWKSGRQMRLPSRYARRGASAFRRFVTLPRGAGCRISGVVDIRDTAVVPHGQREIPAEGVLELYQAAGWWPERTAEQVRAVLRASPAMGAWHGQDLIGFARAVTDGILRAYVEDVVVSPNWRGMGVGHALLAGLIGQLGPVPIVTLFCSPDLVRYYEASSFRRSRQVVMHRSQQADLRVTGQPPKTRPNPNPDR
jgi:GNAT superfamily N-acetyltransferase